MKPDTYTFRKGDHVITNDGQKLMYYSQVNEQEHLLVSRDAKNIEKNAETTTQYFDSDSFELEVSASSISIRRFTQQIKEYPFGEDSFHQETILDHPDYKPFD